MFGALGFFSVCPYTRRFCFIVVELLTAVINITVAFVNDAVDYIDIQRRWVQISLALALEIC